MINPKNRKGHFTREKSDINPAKIWPIPMVNTREPPRNPICVYERLKSRAIKGMSRGNIKMSPSFEKWPMNVAVIILFMCIVSMGVFLRIP